MSGDNFITDYIVNTSGKIGYLAQHCLFDQIPSLAKDFNVPDYCSILLEEDEAFDDVIVNSWFGPLGCSSPLHHDPYHNLLVHVVGYKFVRLFSPSQSAYLSCLPGKFSNNSSLDISEPTSALSAEYTDVLLGPGDVLFIPRWYWHYIASESDDNVDSLLSSGFPVIGIEGQLQKNSSKKRGRVSTISDEDEIDGAFNNNSNYVFSVSFWWGKRIEKEV